MKTIAIHLRLETASHRRRMMGIFRYADTARTWDLRIVRDEEEFRAMLQDASRTRPDGIISCVPCSEQTKRAMADSGVCFVGLGMTADRSIDCSGKAGFVLNDNAGIGKAAAEHFLSLGRFRSYAFMPDTRGRDWSRLRGKAFTAALRQNGKTCRIYRNGMQDDDKELAAFLAALPKPVAAFAAWDGRAADVIRAAHLAQLRIPNDVSVIGVDDDMMICEHTVPTLTSVRTDAEGMGAVAARLLDELMSGRVRGHAKSICRPILGIAERGSTRSPAPASNLIQRAISLIGSDEADDLTPADVARRLGVSRRLLDLRFQQYEAKSVAAMIADRKLGRAKRLLADSDMPIKDVLRQAGFGNVSYATKLFKDTTGTSPAEWRKSHTSATVRQESRRDCFERLNGLNDTDAAALQKLARQLTPEAAFDTTSIRKSMRSGTTAIFALRRRARIVASACAVLFSTPTGSHCRIEDVVVDENFRGRGLGRRIMAGTLEALKSQGVTTVELTSRASRVAANALYRSLGFKLHKTNVYKRGA